MGERKGIFVILLPTLECNLACTYCFEEHPRGRWDLDTTDHVLDQVLELARRERADHLSIHWQGGEALLMGVDYWRRACETARAKAQEAGVSIDQRMQTNLVRYDSALAPLVHEHFDGMLGTSFEPGSARRYQHGDGSRFRARWRDAHERALADGVKVGVISLIDDDAIDQGAAAHIERLRNEFRIHRLRYNLPFSQAADDGMGYWADPEAAGDFLVDAYRWWVAHGRDTDVYLKPFRFLEGMLGRGHTTEPGLCIFTSNCADVSLTVGPDGTVALCDSFISTDVLEPYGNLFEAPLWRIYRGAGREKARRMAMSQLAPECMQCRYIPVCHGGCPVRSHLRTDGHYHYCLTYKKLYGAIEAEVAPRRAGDGTRALPLLQG